MIESLPVYFQTEARLLHEIPLDRVAQFVMLLERARAERRRIFLFGNGGSAATASHFACDLGKGTVQPDRPRFRVTCLNDNVPTFSAYANDTGYGAVFAEPLLSLADRGDVAIAFSASGNSPNVLAAMDAALTLGVTRIGLTGFSGGKLKDCVDLHIHIPSDNFGLVEDLHLAITHAICEMLKLDHGRGN